MAYSMTIILVICSLILMILTGTEPRSSSIKSRRKAVRAQLGGKYVLKCPVKGPEEAKWFINRKQVNATQDISKYSIKRRNGKEILTILKITKKDRGLYACVTKGKTTSWHVVVDQAYLKDDQCPRRPRTKKAWMNWCPERLDFSKCQSLAGKPENFQVFQFIYNKLLTVQAQWTMPKTGNSDLWGYDLEILGLQGDISSHQCVQINRKNKTFWSFQGLTYGAEYILKLRSLPSNKLQTKTIQTLDKCQFEEFRYASAVCLCSMSEVNSTLEVNEGKVYLVWKVDCPKTMSINHFMIYSYNLQLSGHKCSSYSETIQYPITKIYNYTLSINEDCRRYNYSIKIQGRDINNKTTREVETIAAFPVWRKVEKVLSLSEAGGDNSLTTNAIIVIAVFGSVIGFALVLVSYKLCCTKEAIRIPTHLASEKKGDVLITKENSETIREKNRVFFIHSRCCKWCNHVICSLERVLAATRLNTRLDLTHSNEIVSEPYRWYCNEISQADYVIVIASNNMKALENCEDKVNDIPVHRQIDWAIGKKKDNIVSAFFNYNAEDKDVLDLIKPRKPFKLPDELDQLILYLLDIEPIQPCLKNPIAFPTETNAFISAKNELKKALKDAKNYHSQQGERQTTDFETAKVENQCQKICSNA